MTEKEVIDQALNRILKQNNENNSECSIDDACKAITFLKVGDKTISFHYDKDGNLEGLTPFCPCYWK